jgi:cation diffusion facilitator family transporter
MTEKLQLSDKKVVITSLLVSLSDVILNFLVALATGSVVLLSQSLQGLSDATTAVILLIGVNRADRIDDARHPFGYGREIFFWVLIAGIFMFVGAGGISLKIGYSQLIAPDAVENLGLALAMLIFGLVTNGYAFSRSLLRMNETDGSEKWWHRFARSGMVETKATFLIDALGTMTAFLGLIAISLYLVTGNPRFDGMGSIAIGLGMMIGSFLLIRDVKSLIVGRAVPDSVGEHIITTAKNVPGVEDILDLRTMYLGSSKLLVILEVHLKDDLSTSQIEVLTDSIKAAIRKDVPHVYRVQVEVETPDSFE